MGSVVEYRCPVCTFTSGKLQLGWGKAGRTTFWGGLARCEPCKELMVADLAVRKATREDPRCTHCNGVLALIEGTSVTVPCPRCHKPMEFETLGTWM